MNTTDMILGHALIIGGCLFLAWGLTSWYMTVARASQGAETVRKPRWTDGIPIISGLLLIMGGFCMIVTEIVQVAGLV